MGTPNLLLSPGASNLFTPLGEGNVQHSNSDAYAFRWIVLYFYTGERVSWAVIRFQNHA